MNVGHISPFPIPVQATSSGPGSSTSGGDFVSAISQAINQVESTQQSAQTATMNLLLHGQGDVHTAALATQHAELSLELFQQVRNKFVSAYQEIMKMPM